MLPLRAVLPDAPNRATRSAAIAKTATSAGIQRLPDTNQVYDVVTNRTSAENDEAREAPLTRDASGRKTGAPGVAVERRQGRGWKQETRSDDMAEQMVPPLSRRAGAQCCGAPCRILGVAGGAAPVAARPVVSRRGSEGADGIPGATSSDCGPSGFRSLCTMNRRFGRVRIAVVGGSLVALVLAVVLILAESGAGQPGGRAGAVRDAEWLLSRLVLPADAKSSSREPAGGGGQLSWRAPRERIADRVGRHVWWVVDQNHTVVAAYIGAHAPAGSTRSYRGWGSDRGVILTEWDIGYKWPAVEDLFSRELQVKLVALHHGRTGVFADAEDIWLAPKPRWAMVPSSARVLELTTPTLSRTFTQANEVQAIAAAINEMKRDPGLFCLSMGGPNPQATFTFRASAEGPVLAQAETPVWARTERGGCDSGVRLAVPGHGTIELAQGKVVERAEAVLGLRITSVSTSP